MISLVISITLIGLLTPVTGWQRVEVAADSFGHYLQLLEFEPTDSTFFWDGRKSIYHPVAAVHRVENLTENQQCADIIMRLYSEYKLKRGEKICWHGVNGQLKEWDGHNFRQYLNDIYNYSNTYSLYRFDSYAIDVEEMRPGDILIIPGFPGHVVMIADILKNGDSMLVAVVEGFTPAVQPFLFKDSDSLYQEWKDGISVSGYRFNTSNLRRLR